MNDYPSMIAPVNHIEPSPRRVRAHLGGVPLVDTTAAKYVWEWAGYPQYYLPLSDFDASCLVDEEEDEHSDRGRARCFGLSCRGQDRPGSLRVFTSDSLPGLEGLVRVAWDAPDAWFEEDEEIFVHPRSPYVRVDAVRSNRSVRVEVDGVVLADATSSVMVFETGLPTRYHLDRTAVDFAHLEPSPTRTPCPYKGRTSEYWSVRIGDRVHEDLAWAYDYPTRQLAPIAGMVAFYGEKVDLIVDDRPLERPVTHFFDETSD